MACLATRLVAKLPSCHDTIVCIVTRLANQTARLSRYKDCIVTQPPAARPSLLSRYKTLYRDTLHQPGRAGALLAVLGALPAVLWHMLGRVVAEPWPYRGPSPTRPCMLCHDTVYCIVTQNSKWAVAQPATCIFFFIHYFFFHSNYWKTTKKKKKLYIYIFSISSRTK